MAENSPIEWTDHTWSPWEGCTKVSPGCDHCYAESMNRWLRKGENWGPGAPRRIYGPDHWEKPLKWNRAATKAGKPLKVFPSVCDPFDNAAPVLERHRFAELIRETPGLTWLLLTKRIGNAAGMLASMFPEGVPPNVWLGATVVNQEEADRDIPKLLATPARVRFLSMEPLLGPVNLHAALCVHADPDRPEHRYGPWCSQRGLLHWVIVGGESGHGARPFRVEWAHSIVRQCKDAGVAVHVKQMGAFPTWDGMAGPGEHWPSGVDCKPLPRITEDDPGFRVHLRERKGGDWSEWPEDLRVREFPEVCP